MRRLRLLARARVGLHVKRLLGEVDGAPQGCRLVHSLLVLALRIGVGDDSGTRLEVNHPLALGARGLGRLLAELIDVIRVRRGHHHRAQRQRHVHLAREPHVSDAAAVRAASGRLEVVDDLHRAHLGRAAHRARRKRRAEHVPGPELVQEGSGHRRRDVHDVRVPLNLHQLFHLDGSSLADPPDVVAAQVHQHDVLGLLLLIREEVHLQRGVLLLGLTPHPSTRQRSVHDGPLLIRAAQNLGRRRHQDAAPRLQIDHVRARVHHPQRAVHVERVRVGAPLEPVRQHELEDVASLDVLFGVRHGGEELLLGHGAVRGRRRRLRQAHGHLAERQRGNRIRLKRPDERVQGLLALGQRRRRVPVVESRVHPVHRVQLLGGVVEHHDVAVQTQAQVRQRTVVVGRLLERELVEVLVSDRVVPHVPDPAAGEALREALRTAGVPPLGDLACDGDRVGLVGPSALALEMIEDGHVVLLGHHLHVGPGTQERETTGLSAAHDGLEKEAGRVALVLLDEAPVREDGRELIIEEAPVQRDEVVTRRG
mmetsp:Transcript_13345/g.56403  ORF Transcript_13345/g.56403 Transcript_13345/m.56403 type:complete len:538 (-) Transcript_13345:220-1833(-)